MWASLKKTFIIDNYYMITIIIIIIIDNYHRIIIKNSGTCCTLYKLLKENEADVKSVWLGIGLFQAHFQLADGLTLRVHSLSLAALYNKTHMYDEINK
jgi:hypothetical protein